MKLSIIYAGVLLILQTGMIKGSASFCSGIPNCLNVEGYPNIAHSTESGPGLSPFGEAYTTLGRAWNEDYCNDDSDGDGFTNGQELGDPCCKWTEASPTELITEGISSPGDPDSVPSNEKLKKPCGGAPSAGGGGGGGGGGDGGGGAAVGGKGAPSANKNAGKPVVPLDDDEDDVNESAVIKGAASTAGLSMIASIVVMTSWLMVWM
jgi:hypothetical protein